MHAWCTAAISGLVGLTLNSGAKLLDEQSGTVRLLSLKETMCDIPCMRACNPCPCARSSAYVLCVAAEAVRFAASAAGAAGPCTIKRQVTTVVGGSGELGLSNRRSRARRRQPQRSV